MILWFLWMKHTNPSHITIKCKRYYYTPNKFIETLNEIYSKKIIFSAKSVTVYNPHVETNKNEYILNYTWLQWTSSLAYDYFDDFLFCFIYFSFTSCFHSSIFTSNCSHGFWSTEAHTASSCVFFLSFVLIHWNL